MAIVNTGQGLPYPDANSTIRDINDYFAGLAQALDKKIVGVYANQTAVTNAGSFVEGSVVWVQDTNILQVWDGAAWRSIYPASPRIYSGTTVPSSALGAVGDFYIRY